LLFIERIDVLGGEAAGFVAAEFVDAVERHAVEAGTDLEPHAAADRIGLREDVPDDEFPVVLAFGVLLQLRVFDLESTEVRREAANRERAVLAADGTQRELAGDDDGRNRFLGSRWGCHDGSPDDE